MVNDVPRSFMRGVCHRPVGHAAFMRSSASAKCSISLALIAEWRESVESLFGIAMLVTALYFVRHLASRLPELMARTTRFLMVATALCVPGLALGPGHT